MARNVTLAELRTRARQRADMVNSTFISDSELNQYVNDSISELYDLLMQKFGEDYFATSQTYSVVADQLEYALPDNFLKSLGVDLQVNGSNFVTIKPFMFSERNKFNTLLSRGVLGYQALQYKIFGNTIRFTQAPNNNSQFRLWYIPFQPVLANDSDTFDGFNGWEQWVVVDSAISMLNKEESDTTELERRKAMLNERIDNAAQNRDAGFSLRVVDTRNITDDEDGLFTGFRY